MSVSNEAGTKLMVNLTAPQLAEKAAALPVAGVGLMRGEFIFYMLGRHPNDVLMRDGEIEFVRAVYSAMHQVARAFYPRPVTYRAVDFKSNEMRSLREGKEYEENEENPSLGLRGCSRYRRDPDLLRHQIAAIAQVIEEGLDNVRLMLPFVRVPQEIEFCRAAIQESGLDPEMAKLWMMAEVPALSYFLGDFSDLVQGVSIGTNDLTQLLFGVDRDNAGVGYLYDDTHPAVVQAAVAIIRQSKELNLETSLCGDGVGRSRDFMLRVLEAEIGSVSVSIDAVSNTLELMDELVPSRRMSVRDGFRN